MGYVFVSYSRADYSDFVARFVADLQQAGVQVWIDKIGLKPGTYDWEQALRDAIRDADCVLFCASPESRKSSFVRDELSIARMEETPIIPVWARGENHRFIDCFPMGYSFIQTIDARGPNYAAGLKELLDYLQPSSPFSETIQTGPGHNRADDIPEFESARETFNPYKGLLAFKEADRRYFFGRETLVETLLERLHQPDTRFLALVGASGSGKSSVMMAGVMPRLREKTLAGSSGWFMLDPVIPGSRPLENLALCLKRHLPHSKTTDIIDELAHKSTRGLYLMGREIAAARQVERLVLLIDQFEELYVQTPSEDERRQVMDILVTTATEPDSPFLILLTLRADFYHYPMNYTDFGALVNQNCHSVLPMTLSELENAITQPAGLPDVRLMFEPGLVSEMVYALRGRSGALAGALPLLQFTLERLYIERQGQTLTRAAYEAMGGVQGAIGTHAEAVYQSLDKDAQEALPAVFLALVNVDERGETTRRRVLLTELPQTDAAKRLVEVFIKNRLLISDADTPGTPASSEPETTPVPVVEVAHEALLRSWKRLVDWIASVADDLRLRDEVIQAAHKWKNAGCPEYLLWKHERLVPVYAMQQRRNFVFDAVVVEFIRPEWERLLEEFATAKLVERLTIVDRWRKIGALSVAAMLEAMSLEYDKSYKMDVSIYQELINEIKQYPLQAIPLVVPLLTHPTVRTRLQAQEIFNQFKEVSSLPALTASLNHDSAEVRQAVVRLLGNIQDAGVIPALITGLKDRETKVRQEAAEALSRMPGADVIPALMTALPDSGAEVRRKAAEVLGRLRDGQAVPALMTLLDDEDEGVRLNAVRALGETGDAHATGTLVALLRSAELPLRRDVAEALGRLRDRQAVPALIAALADEDEAVRQNAVWALGETGDASAVPALMQAFQQDVVSVRRDCVAALGRTRDVQAVFLLIAALEDEDSEIRQNAVQALGDIGDVTAVPALIAVFHASEDSQLRWKVLETLGRMEDIRVIRALSAALNDVDVNVRQTAAYLLGRMGDVMAVPPLSIALNDEGMRLIATFALARIGTSAALAMVAHEGDIAGLMGLMDASPADDEDAPEIALALENIGTPETLAAVQRWRERQQLAMTNADA